MPFVKKIGSNRLQRQKDAHALFIGRTNELLFFVQNVLKPEDPTFNIISISGQGGVGKSTLLKRFIDEAHTSYYKDYCITALVDERQATPVSIMEKMADQLHLKGQFEKALKHYKEVLRQLHPERETFQDDLLQRVPDIAGAVVEGIPFAGPLLREGAKVTTKHLLSERQASTLHKDAKPLDYPIEDLTKAFITELNQLADTAILLDSRKIKRRRVILFFDTFEKLAVEIVPWLLNHFLTAEIKNDIVLVVAGRHPIQHSTPNYAKHWLPYLESGVIYSFILNSFTQEETRAYLAERAITDSERIDTIWKLSLGLPLYLGFLTSHPQGEVDPAKDVVDNFLRWIPEQEQVKRQLALDAALFSRPFNQDDLEAFTYLPKDEYPTLYRWLIEQPFVRAQDGRYSYHEVARELFSRHEYQRSKRGFYATRRALANHYEQLLEESHLEEDKDASSSSERLELSLALVQQLSFLPDKANHVKIIEHVLSAYYTTNKERRGEIISILSELRKEQFNNRASTQEVVEQLLYYIDVKSYGQVFLRAANYLLESVASEPAFPTKLLGTMYQQRGRAFLRFGEYQRAIQDFDRALDLDSKNVEAYIYRGWTYFELEEYQKAITEIEHALKLDPGSEKANRNLSQIYLSLNDYQQAITNIDHVLEL